MKKAVIIFITLVLIAGLFACGNDATQPGDLEIDDNIAEPVEPYAEEPEEDQPAAYEEAEELPYVSVPAIDRDLRVLSMSSSLTSVLAVLEDGSLWMWEGFDTLDRETWEWILADWSEPPVWIKDNAAQVIAGPSHHLAIDADNVLWGWGQNRDWSVVGDGTSEPRPYPVPIMENVIYAAISPVFPNSHAGDGVRSFAITESGELWGWGQNGLADAFPVALGDGTDTLRREPVWIMDHVSSVTPTQRGAYATDEDGVEWWWGHRSGWIDEDTRDAIWSESRLYPVRVDGPDYVPHGGIGRERPRGFHYEIDENGTLWTMGENQLPEHWNYMPLVGDGTTEVRTSPVQVMDNVQSLTTIADTVFVIDTGGTLWAWGPNSLGQLGDGTTEPRLSPVRIMDNVAEVSSHYFMDHGGVGFVSTFVLTQDGSLWRIGSLRGHGNSVSRVQGEPTLLPVRLH